jgi:hypothetical protein
MPDPKKYNLDFRPVSYWGPQKVETHVAARVKGELRRQQAIHDLEDNHADHEIISESLTEEHRRAAGAVHPWLMGGEYLSDLKPNEVEIARVVMQSTTMDVISIRARKTKNRIIYKIIDEYPEDEFQNYSLTKKTSKQPLTLGELIKLIDNAVEGGLVGSGRNWHFEEGTCADEIYDFETASSAFYTELSEWYDEANEEWLHEKQSEEAQAELEEEYEERYLAGDPSESPEEEVWRNTHKNDLDRERIIRDHLSKSEWKKIEGKYAGWGNSVRYNKIRLFIEEYLDSKNSLPTGIHSIDGSRVKFKE